MVLRLISILLLSFWSFSSNASHVLGGDLTWTCQGGNYVFQLVFYRDCNGADVNPISVTMDVWNHPTINAVPLAFFSREDVSPICSEVPGGPAQLECGIGANAGNGVGAIEKVTYKSDPIALPGAPPAEGWIFTYQDFSRSTSLTNITDPSTVGITIAAKMFDFPGSNGSCMDNSPQFLQEPYFVSCVGDPYEYNMNAVDVDLDSLYISFALPYNNFPGATSYNPPIEPSPIAFEPGFSFSSPTPDASMNAGNISAQVDPSSGNLTFLSNNIGNFAVKISAQSYRDGFLIAEVEREMQLIVQNCAGNNNAPVINGPFAGSFETTITAGDFISFTLNSTDVELLQDGTPQSNILLATGPMFGTGYTLSTGCDIEPCATLDQAPLITMTQGVTTDFSWQTSCDHLVTANGNGALSVPYHFVFKVQDDYCPVPKVSYATITINVENPGIIPAPEIYCIQDDGAGNMVVSFDPVTDPFGTFVAYELHSVQNGIEASELNINASSISIPQPAQSNAYYLVVTSGCGGNSVTYSDTVSNIFLNLTNPGNGTAVLQWNDPITPPLSTMSAYYYILQEYPSGTWTIIDSVLYGVTNYLDTIDICDAFLNYQILLPNSPCDFSSNIDGDNFEDMINPDIPVIQVISIDTLTGQVYIEWNENGQPDTYGYVIYVEDVNGFIVEIDTVWGLSSTSYFHDTIVNGPLTYSVAAFDSCFTSSIPPTYQTSAKAELHTTMYLQTVNDICGSSAQLSWSPYVGWAEIDHYEIYSSLNGTSYVFEMNATGTTASIPVLGLQNYCFFVKAIGVNGRESFSNISCLFINSPSPPAFNYLQVATVQGEDVLLRHYIEDLTSITGISIQRLNGTVYEELGQIPVTSQNLTYLDATAEVNERSYTYRVQYLDSCGLPSDSSNIARTIFLEVDYDDLRRLNYLQWNAYVDFDGSIIGYNIYRAINDIYDPTPITTVGPSQLSFVDSLAGIQTNGRICYEVEAIESFNQYGFSERSLSNEACAIYPPIVYIPNAFIPEDANSAINEIFIPVLGDFDPLEYEFTVFDRWGGVIFNSNDPLEGWNGIIRGTNRMAQTGTYLYLLVLRDGNGEEVVRRGHVSLLK